MSTVFGSNGHASKAKQDKYFDVVDITWLFRLRLSDDMLPLYCGTWLCFQHYDQIFLNFISLLFIRKVTLCLRYVLSFVDSEKVKYFGCNITRTYKYSGGTNLTIYKDHKKREIADKISNFRSISGNIVVIVWLMKIKTATINLNIVCLSGKSLYMYVAWPEVSTALLNWRL